MSFEIKTENFEGPIDALLHLIEKRKLPINEVSLAEITDDYINFVKTMENQSLINMTHFIYVASTLTLIKSKSLLPNLELTDEEDDDIEDLKHRIEIFNVFVEASKSLKNEFSTSRRFYIPRNRKDKIFFIPHKDFNVDILEESLANVINDIPKVESKKKEAYMRIVVNIEEMMDSLGERIKKAVMVNFSTFIKDKTEDLKTEKEIKVYNVIGFLAMLELVKNGILNVLQKENFNEISIESAKQETALLQK